MYFVYVITCRADRGVDGIDQTGVVPSVANAQGYKHAMAKLGITKLPRVAVLLVYSPLTSPLRYLLGSRPEG